MIHPGFSEVCLPLNEHYRGGLLVADLTIPIEHISARVDHFGTTQNSAATGINLLKL